MGSCLHVHTTIPGTWLVGWILMDGHSHVLVAGNILWRRGKICGCCQMGEEKRARKRRERFKLSDSRYLVCYWEGERRNQLRRWAKIVLINGDFHFSFSVQGCDNKVDMGEEGYNSEGVTKMGRGGESSEEKDRLKLSNRRLWWCSWEEKRREEKETVQKVSRKRKRFRKEPEGGSTTRRGGGGSEERRGGSNSRRWPPERGERSSLDRAWGWKHHKEAKSQQRKEIVFLPLSWCFDTTHTSHTTNSSLSQTTSGHPNKDKGSSLICIPKPPLSHPCPYGVSAE